VTAPRVALDRERSTAHIGRRVYGVRKSMGRGRHPRWCVWARIPRVGTRCVGHFTPAGRVEAYHVGNDAPTREVTATLRAIARAWLAEGTEAGR